MAVALRAGGKNYTANNGVSAKKYSLAPSDRVVIEFSSAMEKRRKLFCRKIYDAEELRPANAFAVIVGAACYAKSKPSAEV